MFVGTALASLAWLAIAYRHLRATKVQGLAFSPLSVVVWWFIPVAHVFQPYRAVRELCERAGAPTWQLPWWWLSWLSLGACGAMWKRPERFSYFFSDPLAGMVGVSVAGAVFGSAAAALFASIVGNVDRGLTGLTGRGPRETTADPQASRAEQAVPGSILPALMSQRHQAAEWFYRVGTATRGPVPLNEIINQIESGQLPVTTEVSRNQQKWTAARSLSADYLSGGKYFLGAMATTAAAPRPSAGAPHASVGRPKERTGSPAASAPVAAAGSPTKACARCGKPVRDLTTPCPACGYPWFQQAEGSGNDTATMFFHGLFLFLGVLIIFIVALGLGAIAGSVSR